MKKFKTGDIIRLSKPDFGQDWIRDPERVLLVTNACPSGLTADVYILRSHSISGRMTLKQNNLQYYEKMA